MNIGVLFPRSNTHPLIGSDFIEGLKAYLRQQGLEKDINFMMESVGFGGSEKEVYAKTEKLLMMDDADMLVGFIDEKILELIKPLILASGKLFILVNPGANHPLNWVPQANIITLSLQHSFLCALAGFTAAKSDQSRKNVHAATASTFYDCGYLHLASMVHEFQASGGSIKYNYINNQVYNEEFSTPELKSFLQENNDTLTLLCVFDSLPASLFYRQINADSYPGPLKLFVSPMMLEKKALENLDSGYNFSIDGYIPWHISVPNESNRVFADYYLNQLKKEPGVFSVLGWETGMIIKEIYTNDRSVNRNGELMVEKLKEKIQTGPRGTLILDPDTQHFISPVVRCSLAANTSAMEMEYNINVENEWEQFSSRQTEGHVSGWTNTYLCY